MIAMKQKLVKIVWVGNTKVEWKEEIKKLAIRKSQMIAIQKMLSKTYHNHCQEISKFKAKVK